MLLPADRASYLAYTLYVAQIKLFLLLTACPAECLVIIASCASLQQLGKIQDVSISIGSTMGWRLIDKVPTINQWVRFGEFPTSDA